MIHVALLGFGTVGSGTAEVLTSNKSMIEAYIGDEINIKYILDLREFPDSPFADRIVHDFNIILTLMVRVSTNGTAAFHDTILNMCVVSYIYVIQNY